MAAIGLVHGPLGDRSIHICVDMQRLFAPGGPWEVPWTQKVLPAIEAIASRHAANTVFTRFIPADAPGAGPGMWAYYYRHWASITLDRIDRDLLLLLPSLQRWTPPAAILNKRVYSPWTEGRLQKLLRSKGTNAVVITGGETDVCVLATVLGAVDLGLRVILVTDAMCSSADETHDAVMALYRSRFSHQIEAATADEVLDNWR
jgi:nicotinamidase-related amidase